MQTFYVVLEKAIMSIYVRDNGSYERIYIEGNPEYTYDINCAKDSVEKLLFSLVNENNLESVGEIDLILIDNENKIVTEVMEKALKEYIKEKIQIDSLICKMSKKMSRDKKMYITQYGINFDGKNYICKGEKINKSEFSLLGYTVSSDELLKYVE